MEDGAINDSQITSSSFKTDGSKSYKAAYGRLNNSPSGVNGGAWCADRSDTSRYLQIDLKREITLSGISTQGQSDEANWVAKYSLKHSKDGINWSPFKEFGREEASCIWCRMKVTRKTLQIFIQNIMVKTKTSRTTDVTLSPAYRSGFYETNCQF